MGVYCAVRTESVRTTE